MNAINENYGKLINLSQHKYKQKYLAILKAGRQYDYSMKQTIVYDYSYDESSMMSLKTHYDIDALRDDIEIKTFFNATNWVSGILRSNGVPKGPTGSAIQIIKSVTEGKRAANCYAHAVVLNDVLCALGFICKYVFCYPIDLCPIDCHVVNLVYSMEKNKWILLDSANNVVFSDKDGNILNIEELRKCLICGEDVEVNLMNIYDNIEHLNRNFIKQKILIYMIKNMYRFGCYKNSYRDGDAKNRNVDFYHLIPSTYMEMPYSMAEYDFEQKVKKTEHYIVDPYSFWCVPENK